MPCSRICLLFLAVAILSSSIVAQQAQEPDSNKPKTQSQQTPVPDSKKPEAQQNNFDIPKSIENWGTLVDIKTGLTPTPPVRVQSDDRPEFVRELLRLQWRTDDPIDVWLIRPKVAGKVVDKVPVIFYLYSYPDPGEHFRDDGWCQRATASGFAAAGFVAALTDYRFKNRSLKKWFISELPEALGSTAHDVQLVLNHFATRGDLDMNRVGVFGMGSGGTIAILAAQADARITTLDVLDPWGDWADWLKDSPVVPSEERPNYVTKEFLLSVSTLDPVSYLPSLKTPNIRIQQTVSEPFTPSKAKEMIAAAAPARATVVKYQNAEDLFNTWKAAGLSGWLKEQLRSKTPKNAQGSDAVQNSAKNEIH